jgi:hypothetical protein
MSSSAYRVRVAGEQYWLKKFLSFGKYESAYIALFDVGAPT